MAKSSRSPASLSRRLTSSTLRVVDEFCNLKDVHLAFACLQGLLSPVHRTPNYEEFSIEPAELRALLTVVNDELERRTLSVDTAIRTLNRRANALTARVEQMHPPTQ
jgi:hypothetical protein